MEIGSHLKAKVMSGRRPDLWRGMICLTLAIGFEEDRARLGLLSIGCVMRWPTTD
jgi:hypothetical protein